MALYRKADMSLDQLMAFTVSDDHAAQGAAYGSMRRTGSAPAIQQTLTAMPDHAELGSSLIR